MTPYGFETETVLVLSNLHVPREQLDLLTGTNNADIPFHYASDTGALVFTQDYNYLDHAPDLDDVLAFARNNKFYWVRFDKDGPTIPHLPTYEWI